MLIDPATGEPSTLWRNDGDGSFEHVIAGLPSIDTDNNSRTAGWFDIDGDGDQDLYTVSDEPTYGTRLLWNEGGSQFERDESTGSHVSINGMGLGLADLNRDGLPDFLISGSEQTALLVSDKGPIWYSAGPSLNLMMDEDIDQVVAWGSELADLNNDGLHDAVMTFGRTDYIPDIGDPDEQPDEIWLQDNDGMFNPVAAEWGLDDRGRGRGFVLADLNEDGFLDIIKDDETGPSLIYVSRCDDSAWLRVRIDGEAPNTRGVGAVITVNAGGKQHTRWLSAGSTNLATSAPVEAHFGFGSVDTVDSIEVRWPSGTKTSLFENVATRQVVTVVQAEAPVQ